MTDDAWNRELAELRAYIKANHRFPSPSKPGQKILAGWWSRQNAAERRGDLTGDQLAAVAEVRQLALAFRDAERAGRTQAGLSQDARDILAFRAREALKKRRLLFTHDLEVLRARSRSPRATAAQLAARLGMSESRFQSRLRRALQRAERRR